MLYRNNILRIIIAMAIGLPILVPRVIAAPTPAQQSVEWNWPEVGRAVIVPDVHGAYDALVRLLQATAVVGEDLKWSGGDTHLVSLGDLLDRGGNSRAVMDLLMRLQEEAPQTGGRVHALFGNHEQMNLIGDLRYVSAGEFAAFAEDESPEMRNEALRDFAASNPDLGPEQSLAAFDDRYPPGYFGHRQAFRPEGRYGKWLLSLPTIIVINDTAFVHGGLPKGTATWTSEQLNTSFRQDLKRYLQVWRELVARGALPDDEPGSTLEPLVTDEMIENPSKCLEERAFECEKIEGDGELQGLMEEFVLLSGSPANSDEAPYWYRGSVYCRDILERPVLDEYLRTLGAERVVVGHTPTSDRRVRSIRDGKVIMTDTGMLVNYYKGRPAALIMQNGKLAVQYLEPLELAAPLAGFGPVAYGIARDGLEQALAEGVVTAIDRESGASYWHVTLDFEGRSVAARFFPGGRRGTAKQELAAYALDRLLGTELVAATVPRRVEGTDGALQLVFPKEISEQARLEAILAVGGWCPMAEQVQLMNVFDLLIANAGRSASNILHTRGDWTLRLSEHGLAFSPTRRLPAQLRDDAVILAPGVAAALARLDPAQLAAALGDYLDKKRIRALLARRDEILQKFGS